MNTPLNRIKHIFLREMLAYFTSPLAYIFIIIFLLLNTFFTFRVGGFFESNEASLQNTFFPFHPWLYLLLVPAISMRLWSEENKSGTIELLFTMPISTFEAVLAKFLSALAILAIALFLTFPLPVTVFYLGKPDVGLMLAGYFASLILAATFLSIGSFTSACTNSQVISFIFSLVLSLIFILIGFPAITDYFTRWAPESFVSLLASMSVIPHYETMRRGILDIKDICYFLSVIIFFLSATSVILNTRKK